MTSTSNDPKKSILVYVVNQSVNIINPPAPCFSMSQWLRLSDSLGQTLSLDRLNKFINPLQSLFILCLPVKIIIHALSAHNFFIHLPRSVRVPVHCLLITEQFLCLSWQDTLHSGQPFQADYISQAHDHNILFAFTGHNNSLMVIRCLITIIFQIVSDCRIIYC